ncbi:MAG: hypothetical protein P4L75_02775, partial [Clostridia bacterium]|nr:hypothetical protein [Clostridia bacterium]
MSDLNGEKVLKIENPYWEFSTAGEGGRVIFRLRDKSRGRIYADGGYFCRIKLDEAAGKKTCAITYDSVSIDADEDAEVLTARGSLKVGPMPHVIELEQRYVLKRQSRWLEEYLTIKNDTDAGIVMKELQFALKKKLYDGSTGWVDGNDGYTLTSVPSRQYRSHRIDRKRDFIGAKDIVYTGWDTEVPGFCEEGWLWGNGEGGLLTCKYNQTEMEYARFESVVESIADLDFQAGPNRALCDTYLVFGGASTCKGEPGRALTLEKGQIYAFGVSKYAVYDGDWQKGYHLYREHLEEMGHVTPEGFDPPIHWNELYNLGWFAEGRERYTKEQLMEEAGLARDVGAESFYMDPGWDIYPGSTIWDEKRLGPLGEFSKTIHEKYGLKLALHLMQSFLSDNEDELFYSLDPDGNRKKHWMMYDFCANGHWADEKGRRLNALADQWVDFFMVDFDEYGGSARDDGCHCP